MDPATIAKDFIGIQKQSLNNFFDTMIVLQDQAEDTGRRWFKQLGFNEETQEIAHQWHAVFHRGRDDSRKFINDSLDGMEDYFAGLEQKDGTAKYKRASLLRFR
ncbi:MAG: hypothetical protein PVH69_01320 [Desulfobacterales bacterium]